MTIHNEIIYAQGHAFPECNAPQRSFCICMDFNRNPTNQQHKAQISDKKHPPSHHPKPFSWRLKKIVITIQMWTAEKKHAKKKKRKMLLLVNAVPIFIIKHIYYSYWWLLYWLISLEPMGNFFTIFSPLLSLYKQHGKNRGSSLH